MAHASPPETKIKNASGNAAKSHQRLEMLLFLLSLSIYLLTRLIRLPDFPIYFFTDEAIQSQHAVDLINNGFRSADGVLLPTYFENGGQFNLSLSVYAQVIPMLIFGKSVWVTRGVSVLLTLVAAISLGLILRNTFKSRYWWLGTLLLTVTPTWFLHSRTAFETVIMTSLYAGFLLFYLRYRDGHPKSLLLSLLFGGLVFYAYSPGQVIIVITGLILLISDAKYHWKNRKTALIGLVLLILLFLPYFRHIFTRGSETVHHLTVLNSYWVKPISLTQKLLTYFLNYLKGLNPIYWFWPDPSFLNTLWPNLQLPIWMFSFQNDLARHTMKGYGHLLWLTFPFWLMGLIQCIKRIKDYRYRTLILVSLAAPAGAAVVDWGITRGLVFIIPAILMTALDLETSLNFLKSEWQKRRHWHISAATFLIFGLIGFWMLGDALTNGPTWFDDYGMGGMQYGGQQIFSRAVEIAQDQPETTIIVSSTWANGSDVIMRYFADDHPNIQMGNINAWGYSFQPLNRNMLFVMTEDDLNYIEESEKFTNLTIEETLDYPDGSAGFYFFRLDYVENIKTVLAKEREERQALISDTLNINGQSVLIQYPILDMNEIKHVFDGDTTTLVRTLEANPLKLILTFIEPTQLSQVNTLIGGTPTMVSASAYYKGEELETQSLEVEGALTTREVQLNFSQSYLVDELRIEILNVHDGEIAHVHLWEVSFK